MATVEHDGWEHEDLDDVAAVYCRDGVRGWELARALESVGWGSVQTVQATEVQTLTWGPDDPVPSVVPIGTIIYRDSRTGEHWCRCVPLVLNDEDRHGEWIKSDERYSDGCREDRAH